MTAKTNKPKGPRDYFWVIIVGGTIATIAIALLLGPFVAGKIFPHESRPAATDTAATSDAENPTGNPNLSRVDDTNAVARESDFTVKSNRDKKSEEDKSEEETETTPENPDASATATTTIETPETNPDEEGPIVEENRGSSLYVIKIDVFGSKDNAETRKKMIEDEFKVEAAVKPILVNGQTMYRVQAGVFSSRANAEKAKQYLGLPGDIVEEKK